MTEAAGVYQGPLVLMLKQIRKLKYIKPRLQCRCRGRGIITVAFLHLSTD